MVYNNWTAPCPQPHNVCIFCSFTLGRGGGQREGRGATVNKRGWKHQHDWLFCQFGIFIFLKVWWHQPFFLFIFYIFRTIHSLRVHSCFLIALRSVEGLPGVPSRDSNSGLPYIKPTHYYLSCAAPYLSCAAPWSELRHTLPELRRTLSELRRTLTELRRTLPELRRTLPELRPPYLSCAAPWIFIAPSSMGQSERRLERQQFTSWVKNTNMRECISSLKNLWNTCRNVPLKVNFKEKTTFRVWCLYRYLVHESHDKFPTVRYRQYILYKGMLSWIYLSVM